MVGHIPSSNQIWQLKISVKVHQENPQKNSIVRSPEDLQEGAAKGFAEVLACLMLADGCPEDRSTMLCKNVGFVRRIGI
jgi:hypothetical protein